MEVANIWLRLDHLHNSVPKHAVTPAEALFLTIKFEPVAQGKPVLSIDITGKVLRSSNDEMKRLYSLYNNDDIAKAFPGAAPQLPKTFAELAEILGHPNLRPFEEKSEQKPKPQVEQPPVAAPAPAPVVAPDIP